MFTDEEIQDVLDVYNMEDELVLNDNCKIMFFAGNAGWDVQLWVWKDEQWITHEQTTVIGTGDAEDDKRYGIQCVMERAETLKFRFTQTRKKTIRYREFYDIEASSLEEAREKAAECDGDLDDCEYAVLIDVEEDEEEYYFSRDIESIYDSEGELVE